jgi:hypothetical protein
MATTTTTTNTISFENVIGQLLMFSNIDSMLELLGLSQDKYDEVGNIMRQFEIDWDNANCDSEGANKEQEADMDGLLSITAEQLLSYV